MWYLIKVVIFLKRNGSIHDKDTVITIFNIAITEKKNSSRENEFLFISVSMLWHRFEKKIYVPLDCSFSEREFCI